MVISRTEVSDYLREFLRPSDQTHIELITDFSWVATLVLEFGFECPAERRKEFKEKFFGLIEKLVDAKKMLRSRQKKVKMIFSSLRNWTLKISWRSAIFSTNSWKMRKSQKRRYSNG